MPNLVLCFGQEGGNGIEKTLCGKGVNILAIVERYEPALPVSTYPVNQHEITLVQLSFAFYMLAANPEHHIGDRAHDTRWDR